MNSRFLDTLVRFLHKSGAVAKVRGPREHWRAVVVGFAILEVSMVAYTAFLFYRWQKEDTWGAGEAPIVAEGAPTLDREKLRMVLNLFEQKAANHEWLQNNPPGGVDPSVRSWYREGAEEAE